jgi:uncharacterized protein (DUF2141 family)
MLVAPCSVKTLSGIAPCYDDELLFRETPLHAGTLDAAHTAFRAPGCQVVAGWSPGSALVRRLHSINTPWSPVMTTRPVFATAVLALLGSLSGLSVQAQECATVEVRNVRPGQGSLMIAAYADADSYGKKPVTAIRLPAGEAVMTFQLCGLAGKDVALMLFQDLDNDGKMGRNLLGLPTEPWGSSGTPAMFGPTWETGRVARDAAPIVVNMSQ